jgi:hypothetical protein
MSNTSIGRGPASGGNENHDGDPRQTTLGEAVEQERPAGNGVPDVAPAATPAGQTPPRPEEGAPPPA